MSVRKTISNLRSRIRRSANHISAEPAEVERAEWQFYISYLRDGMIAFDVGAYIGELTVLFSHFVRENGKVHSFEANPESFIRLKSFVETSGRKNIQLNASAVADHEGELEFFQYDTLHLSWSTLAERPLEKYGISVKPVSKIKVPGTTLDLYCEKNGLDRIDLLKIDVEGAEYQVMNGAQKMFAGGKIGCCIFEFGQTTFDMGNRPEQIETFLKSCGYTLQNVVSSDPIFPGKENAMNARFSMHVAMPHEITK